MMAPRVNKVRVKRRMGLRPRRVEREDWTGWKTVEERRKDVPAQKASMALPWRVWEIICIWGGCVSLGERGFDGVFGLEGWRGGS